ncbi:MAG: HAD family phosphatase [Nitrospirae bacterium]|nr:HAD family phosphatase [Nitrospirota bacterium]
MPVDRSIKAVIWDCGGVLVRTEDPSGRRKWEQKLGLSPFDIDRVVLEGKPWVQAQCGEISEEEYWNAVRLHLDLDEKAIRDLRRDFYMGDRVNPVVLDLVTRFRPHYKQAVLSNAAPSLLETLRERFHIAHLFDVIVTSASIGVMKPDPRAYRAALDALNLRAEQTIFIDDLHENIQGAKQLGMHVIHFDSGNEQLQPRLLALLSRGEL